MLQAAARPALEVLVEQLELAEAIKDAVDPRDVVGEDRLERRVVRPSAAQQTPIRAHRAPKARALDENQDDQEEHEESESAEDEGQVLGEEAVEIGHRESAVS